MIYKVYLDDVPILDTSHNISLVSANLELGDNSAGSFSFDIDQDNPGYQMISSRLMTGIITVKWGDEILYKGRLTTSEKDFYNQLHVESEGELAYLDDSIQRPGEYHDISVRDYLQTLINAHNSQVEAAKQFTLGSVTVMDSNNSLYRYTNWESTLTTIKEDLIDSLGGHLRVRYADGKRYLDYLEDYPRLSGQKIEFGENLMDYSENVSGLEIATVCIPLGARQEESEIAALEKRLTIESVNSKKDYLEITSAVNRYGRIVKTAIWDDVNTPSILKAKGQKWLSDNQYETLELSLTAVDLQDFGLETDHFRLLDRIRCTSVPHGMDREFPLTAVSLDLLNPENSKYTLGAKAKSFASSTSRAQVSLQTQMNNQPSKSNVLQTALDNATNLINMAGKDGHVIFNPSIRSPQEMLIIDADTLDEAQNLWRWNLNGLGYSSNGYAGPFDLAITMDGTIAGKFIAAGSIGADQINVSYTTAQEKKWQTKLGDYWTATETQTQIKNSADSVTLSAKQYTTDSLKSYYTSAQIDVKTNAIESTVSKKVGASEVTTIIEQNPSSVKISWNKISNYIEFEAAQMLIKNSSGEKYIAFTSTGMKFFRNDVDMGHMGVAGWANTSWVKGIVTWLNYSSNGSGASYWAIGAKESSNASVFTTKLMYVNEAFDDHAKDRFYLGCHMDCQGYHLVDGYYQGRHASEDGSQGISIGEEVRIYTSQTEYYRCRIQDGILVRA